MSGRKVLNVGNGLKQTDLLTYFSITKTSTNKSKQSPKLSVKPQRKPNRKIFKRKSPKNNKPKTVESESEDDACDPYFIIKTQKENLTQDDKLLTLNRPTPLKKKFQSNLKCTQVKKNILGTARSMESIPDEMEESSICDSQMNVKIEQDETSENLFGVKELADTAKKELLVGDEQVSAFVAQEKAAEFDPDATLIMDPIDLTEEGISDDDSFSADAGLSEVQNGGTFEEFKQIISYVENQPNLFSVLYAEEQKLLKTFSRLPEKYRYFCFRLFTRRLVWYEVHSLVSRINIDMDYVVVAEMIKVLGKKKIVHTDYSSEEPVDLLNRLLTDEVKLIYRYFKIKGKHKKKEELIKAILKHCSSQSTLTAGKSSDDLLMDRIKENIGDSVKLDLTFYNTLSRVHLLYSFMNPDMVKPSDLYLFMQSIRQKKTKLPTYSTDFTTVFTREKFLRYFLAVEHHNEYILAKEHSDERKMLKITKLAFDDFKQIVNEKYDDEKTTVLSFHKRFTAGRVLAKILSMACKQFTTDSGRVLEWLQFLVKQDQYAVKRRGDWYSHIAMIHEKQKEFDYAVDVLIEAFVDPYVPDICKHELSHRASRLLNRCEDEEAVTILRELILSPPDKEAFPFIVVTAKQNQFYERMRLMYDLNGGTCAVENVALNHYKVNGFPKGLHCEGQLMTTIYILLFWDIIFDKYVPGTFISEIQYVPLDFHSSDFYKNRKEDIDRRLEEIETGWSEEELERSLRARILEHHDVFTLTTLDIVQGDVIMDAVKCMGRRVLCKILERFIQNFRDHRAGMPDLFICNPHTLQYKFVEVKSENDNLSMKQKVWLNYLRSVGAVIEMCHVISEGRKVKRKLLKKKE